jgi:hypothetical protein
MHPVAKVCSVDFVTGGKVNIADFNLEKCHDSFPADCEIMPLSKGTLEY